MQADDTDARVAEAVALLDPQGFVPGVHAGVWFVGEPQVLASVSLGVRGAPRAWVRVMGAAVCRDGLGRGLDFRHEVARGGPGAVAGIVAEEVVSWNASGGDGPFDAFVAGMVRFASACAPEVTAAREATLAHCVAAMVGLPSDHPSVTSACRASTRRLSMRMSAFLSSLDAGAASLLVENHGVGGILARCWPGLDARLSPDVPLAAALALMPGHPLALAESWLADPDGFRLAMASGRLDRLVGERVVASGHLPARLLPILGRVDAILRGDADVVDIRGRETLEHPSARYGLPLAIARRLSALPAGWEPADDAECAAFVRLVPVVDRAAGLARGPALPALLNAGGRWVRYAAKLRRATGGKDPLDALDDLRDVVRAFLRQVLGPAVLSSGMAKGERILATAWIDAAWKLLWSGRSLPRILEASARWHRVSGALDAAWMEAASARGGTPSWGAGLPCATYGDVRIEVLVDDASLLAEGARHAHDGTPGLSHCVGGYGPNCRAGGTRVASVRRTHGEGSWTRLSTVAFDVRGPLLPVVAQHRGRDNGEPPPEALEAVNRYVREIREGVLSVDPAGLVRVPEPPMPGWGGAVRLAGPDWASVRDAWARMLPGPLRALDAGEFAALAKASLAMPGSPWLPETPGTPAYAARLAGARRR